MIVPSRREAKHKVNLIRMLQAILQNSNLAPYLAFKGGTYAALRNLLDRFSVNLDFDLIDKSKKQIVKQELEYLIDKLGFVIKDHSTNYIQYFLRYDAPEGVRNTLKIDINDEVSKFGKYEKVNLEELNMIAIGHTVDTMFANKLIASMDRYAKNGKIAGRDFYDIHSFFYQGLDINIAVVEGKSGLQYIDFLKKLTKFIDKHVSEDALMLDLNSLLPVEILHKRVSTVVSELPMLIKDEMKRFI